MTVYIRKVFNQGGQETGSILSSDLPNPATAQQKLALENQLINYAHTTLYPRQGLNIYRDVNVDTLSVTVIRDINNLPQTQIVIP